MFDLTVERSGETVRFRVDVDERAGEGMIVSISDSGGRDPGIKATFALADMNGLTTAPLDKVGHIAFPGLGRAFLDFRLREGQPSDSSTSPPSGLWEI